MIIPPDISSENDMRWRLALANNVSKIQTGEQLAAACTLAVGAIIVVGLLCLIAAAKSGVERPIKVYKKRAQMNAQEKRVMTGTAISHIGITLVACVIAFITKHIAIGAITFAVSVLVATIVFEVLSDRADKREDALKGLLDPDRLQLPKDLTLNDVVLWQATVEQAETQKQAA